MPRKSLIIALLPLLFAAIPAQAYIGPGAGLGSIAVVLGILASIGMALLAVIWYPIKRLVKARRRANVVQNDAADSPDKP